MTTQALDWLRFKLTIYTRGRLSSGKMTSLKCTSKRLLRKVSNLIVKLFIAVILLFSFNRMSPYKSHMF
jgi:hypothetical protein